MTKRDTTILVLGNFDDYAVQRLSGEFNVQRMATPRFWGVPG